MFYKPEFRKSLRSRRQQLDSASIQQAAEQVAAKLIVLPEFIKAKHIASYVSDENELDPNVIINAARHLDKHIFLPVIPTNGDKHLTYYPYDSDDTLVANHYNILEPKTNSIQAADTESFDIILVPLVGFDKHCNRLGRGAGYYDHSLAFTIGKNTDERPLLVGLAYEFQKLSEFEPSKWDVPLDIIITEKEIYQRM